MSNIKLIKELGNGKTVVGKLFGFVDIDIECENISNQNMTVFIQNKKNLRYKFTISSNLGFIQTFAV